LGRTTNNVAEYTGLLAALTWAQRHGVDDLDLFSDSELGVKQTAGAYKVKAPHLVPLFLQVLALKCAIPRCRIRHVPRAQNARADKMVNRAIDERLPVPEWLQPALRATVSRSSTRAPPPHASRAFASGSRRRARAASAPWTR